jgi:hypothetical protein
VHGALRQVKASGIGVPNDQPVIVALQVSAWDGALQSRAILGCKTVSF